MPPFDFFSDRLPAEIRNAIYKEMKEMGLKRVKGKTRSTERFSELKNMSLACRQANDEVSGIIHSVIRLKIKLLIQFDDQESNIITSPRYHNMIWSFKKCQRTWENPEAPIALSRKPSELTGLQQVERIDVHIVCAGFTTEKGYRARTKRLKRDARALSQIFVELYETYPRLKILNIRWLDFMYDLKHPVGLHWIGPFINQSLPDLAERQRLLEVVIEQLEKSEPDFAAHSKDFRHYQDEIYSSQRRSIYEHHHVEQARRADQDERWEIGNEQKEDEDERWDGGNEDHEVDHEYW